MQPLGNITDLDHLRHVLSMSHVVHMSRLREIRRGLHVSGKPGHNVGSPKQIDCVERFALSIGRRPLGVLAQIGVRITLYEPDDHLGDDTPPTGPSRSPSATTSASRKT